MKLNLFFFLRFRQLSASLLHSRLRMIRRLVSRVQFPSTSTRRAGIFVHRDTKESNTEIPFEWTEENLVRIQAIKNQYPYGNYYFTMIRTRHLLFFEIWNAK